MSTNVTQGVVAQPEYTGLVAQQQYTAQKLQKSYNQKIGEISLVLIGKKTCLMAPTYS
jgi:hypothetical protein